MFVLFRTRIFFAHYENSILLYVNMCEAARRHSNEPWSSHNIDFCKAGFVQEPIRTDAYA